jgi:hypothetical protein
VPDPTRERPSFQRFEGELPSSIRSTTYQPAATVYSDIGAGHLVAQ